MVKSVMFLCSMCSAVTKQGLKKHVFCLLMLDINILAMMAHLDSGYYCVKVYIVGKRFDKIKLFPTRRLVDSRKD